MLGAARTSEHGLGALVRPAFKLGDRDEPEFAPPDQPQLRLDVALEGVQRHAKRDRSLLAAEGDARDIAGLDSRPLLLRYSNCSDWQEQRKGGVALTDEERDPADPWLTLAEIAAELRVNPATVRLWVSKGQLKASRAGVRKWIVRRSDLDRMLAETNLTPDEVLEQVGNRLQAAGRLLPLPAALIRHRRKQPRERASLRQRRRRPESHGHLKHRGRWSCCSAR